jgi:hypothetical protein
VPDRSQSLFRYHRAALPAGQPSITATVSYPSRS